MTTKIYACYGILAHEKEVIYHTSPTDICDEITVEIPESLHPYMSIYDEVMVSVCNPVTNRFVVFSLEEILTTTKDGEPALEAFGWLCNLNRLDIE